MSKRIRMALEEGNKRADYATGELKAQADAINLQALKADIDIVAHSAAVLIHADEVMRSGVHRHPMAAFMHSVECNAPVDDRQFFILLEAWGKIISKHMAGAVVIQPKL